MTRPTMTDFAAGIAGAVIDFDQANPDDLGPAGPVSVAVLDPDTGAYYWQSRTDPLPGLMTMLANNPAAAQQVFTEGFDVLSCNLDTTWIDVDRQTVPVDTRLAWLLTRPWDTGWSDNGAGFGQALEAATTTWRDTDSTGQASARIATQVFALTGQSQAGAVDLSDPLKTSLAAMLAGFMPDVMRVSGWSHETRGKDDVLADGLFTGDRDWDFPPGMPSGVALTQDEVYNLMYGLGHSANVDANLAVVTTGWAVAEALSMNYRIQAYQANYTDARNTAQEDMSAMSFLVHAGMDGADAAHAEHEQAAAAMSRALTMLAAIPILKAPAEFGQWGAYVWDQTKSALVDAAGNAITSVSDPTPDPDLTLDQVAEQGVQIWADAMVNNGGLPQTAYDVYHDAKIIHPNTYPGTKDPVLDASGDPVYTISIKDINKVEPGLLTPEETFPLADMRNTIRTALDYHR